MPKSKDGVPARTFAARVRAARAVVGWGQRELAARAGITQKSVYRIERGEDDVRHSTVAAIDAVFANAGISFQQKPDGGFTMAVETEAIIPPT